MTEAKLITAARLAAITFAVAGAAALAGCEEHPYPAAAPTAAPPEGEAAQAGAPTTRTPEYVPPPSQAYPPPPGGYGPPPGAEAGPPPPGGYGPPPPGAYPPPYPRAPSGPPEVVTMAPIPNPPEAPPAHRRHHHMWRRHGWGYAAPVYEGPAYAPHRRHFHPYRYAAPAYAPAASLHHRHAAAPAAPVHPVRPAHHAVAPASHTAPAAPPAPAAQLPKPAAPEHHKHHHAAAAAGAATGAAAGGANVASNATGAASGTEADRFHTLEQALKDDFASVAELKAPAHMETNQASTVTLTLPADFAQTVRNEAAKQNLSEAAKTVNLVASLTGDGYVISPDQPQTQALTLNAPTTFSWKVTPTGSGRAALKASVRADTVSDGHDLDLGSKSTGSGATTGRVVGIGLLALIALVLLGWAAQRRRPAPVGATKPRANGDAPKP